MVTLLKTAYRRVWVDIKGWEISAKKLISCGYKYDEDHPDYISVPEIMTIIDIERWDVLKRLIR